MVGLGVNVANAGEPLKEVAKKLKSNFPGMKFSAVENSPIEGLYEVQAGNNILYYYPKDDLLVFGEIWNREGKSLTGLKKEAAAAKLIKDLPLDLAVKVGNGKNIVIEFTDPDCPFCRKANNFLKDRKDITRYIFFTPLAMHSEAPNKVKYILAAKDKVKAHDEVFSGKLDAGAAEAKDEKSAKLLSEHQEWGAKLGVNGTPAFWINGSPVVGANIPAINKLLGGGAIAQ